MAARSVRTVTSFDLLAEDSSIDDRALRFPSTEEQIARDSECKDHPLRRRRKSRGSRKKKKKKGDEGEAMLAASPASGFFDGVFSPRENGHAAENMLFSYVGNRSVVDTVCESTGVEREVSEGSHLSCVSFPELRQRNVNGVGLGDRFLEEEAKTRESSTGKWGRGNKAGVTMLKKEESLDWNRVMAEHPDALEGTFR